ncbi:MAG TPA: AI-2E family transporter, partial [Solirubrobacteraceae bacterium]
IASPLIFGHALRINPLLVIFALLFGAELFGIVGALVALPVAAVVRETLVYLRQHLVLEPWGTMTPLEIVEARSARMRCPECGGRCAAGDAFCPTCGVDLARPQVPSGT